MVDGAVTGSCTLGAADRIGFLGHSTVLIELGGVRLLTDPLLRSRVAHLRRHAPPLATGAAGEPDAVLISHLHHDHLDLSSLRLLGRDTRLIVPVGAGDWLARRGFTRVSELACGASERVGAVSVGGVEARHDGHRVGGPDAQALGYLVEGERTVYFAGDTGLFAEMAEIAPQVDIALLPVGGWGPSLGPGHMDPLEAARAAALLRARIAIPIHWGTFLPIGMARRLRAGVEEPPRLFAEHLARLAPEIEVRVLAPGEETIV